MVPPFNSSVALGRFATKKPRRQCWLARKHAPVSHESFSCLACGQPLLYATDRILSL